MYAIMGITGQVGGAVARALLAEGKSIRAIVRDAGKGRAWSNRGCEVALANINDSRSLAAALQGVEGAFVLVPPNFDPSPGFPEAQALGAVQRAALETAKPARVVYLSTIGAQARESNLLTQHTIIEKALSEYPMPITLLRPAWFMENYSWDVAAAREQGLIASFLQPLDKPVPMVATEDIGKEAAKLLQETWTGHRIVEAVPPESWETLFTSQGMKNPIPRIRMLDGFNEGWIEFEHGEAGSKKGTISLETVLKALVETEIKKPDGDVRVVGT